MELELFPHPDGLPGSVLAVRATVARSARVLDLCYVVETSVDGLAVPPPAKPYRTDELWRTTCFELFMRETGPAYREFNFSPSSQWAAYGFSSYREGMISLPVDSPPSIHLSDEDYALILSVQIEAPFAGAMTVGLSAVIEELDSTKSYWALAHPPSGPPDFHHPACFVLELPPASGA